MPVHFDQDHLSQLAHSLKDQYQSAQPFPHIYIDNFMDPEVLSKALTVFPSKSELDFYKYDNPLEKKLAMDQIGKLPVEIADILIALNSPPFLQFLEIITGIDGIIPDPYYRGGGIHQIESGGKLDIHIDFNKHLKLNLDRRINVLLYLNKDWDESYGGHFEIWKGHQQDGQHVLESCETKILPVFNRLALFSTSEQSYHGHPEPLTCPEDRTRKSIATYYYTATRVDESTAPAHSTTFIKRPNDPESAEIDALRKTRNQGRVHTNVNSENVAN